MKIYKCHIPYVNYKQNSFLILLAFLTIGHASLVFILCDVRRYVRFSGRLVQEVISLVFNPMLSLWVI